MSAEGSSPVEVTADDFKLRGFRRGYKAGHQDGYAKGRAAGLPERIKARNAPPPPLAPVYSALADGLRSQLIEGAIAMRQLTSGQEGGRAWSTTTPCCGRRVSLLKESGYVMCCKCGIVYVADLVEGADDGWGPSLEGRLTVMYTGVVAATHRRGRWEGTVKQ